MAKTLLERLAEAKGKPAPQPIAKEEPLLEKVAKEEEVSEYEENGKV